MKKSLTAIVLAAGLMTGCIEEVKCTGEATVMRKELYYDAALEVPRMQYIVQTPCGEAQYRPGLLDRSPAPGEHLYGTVRGRSFMPR